LIKLANSIIFCLATTFSYSQIHPQGKGIAYKFIENKNQWPSQVKFRADIPGGKMYLLNQGFIYDFYDAGRISQHHHNLDDSNLRIENIERRVKHHAVNVQFENSNTNPELITEYPDGTRYNYLIGNDPSHWGHGAKGYFQVKYLDLYSGVDVVIYSNQKGIKYDILVKPNADPSQIKLTYTGADNLLINGKDLIVKTSLGKLIESRLIAYQIVGSDTLMVDCEFAINQNTVEFEFPAGYDSDYNLIIDPLLIFSTFSGATADNFGYTAAFDESGNLYSGGIVFGQGFPTTMGSFDSSFNGGTVDVGILKYDSTGTQLIFATYLGGIGQDVPHSLVVTDNEELIILGTTSSGNYPTTTDAFNRLNRKGPSTAITFLNYIQGTDIFITKLDAEGSALLGSTFVGGTNYDGNQFDVFSLRKNYGDQFRGDVIVDNQQNIYVTTVTMSSDFPVINGLQSGFGGGITDAVVFKMSPTLNEMIWSTYIGGSNEDAAYSIKIDDNLDVFIGGGTTSTDFPGTGNGYNPTALGQEDGFIAKIASDGSQILNASYVGTTAYDQVFFIDLDTQDNVYMFGQTRGNYPVTAGKYTVPNSGQFIHKVNNSLDSSMFSTVFGSGTPEPNISPTAFLVNECDNLYVTGWGGLVNNNNSSNTGNTFGLQVTPDAEQTTTDGSDFYLMVLSSNAEELLYATYFGGTNNFGDHVDGGTSRFDKRGIVYHAVCSCGGQADNFPATPGAWSTVNLGVNALGAQRCNNAAFKFDLASLRARLQTNNVELTQPGFNGGCEPIEVVFQNESIGGEEFEWDFGDGNVITTTDTSDIVHLYEKSGTYSVVLRAFDKNTCISEDFATTTILVSGIDPVVGNGGDICEGDSFKLFANGGAIYQWSPPESLDDAASPSPMATPIDTTVYKVLMDNGLGCQFEDSVTVNVISIISSDFVLEKDLSCNESPVFNFTTQFEESEAGFNWDFGDGQTSTDLNVSHTYEADGNYNVKLITQNEFCKSENTMVVQSVRMNVPNVITPNSDIYNQFLKIGAVEQVELIIFNRWGREVFITKDYQNDWDGKGLATGVYYFDLKVVDKVECSGWIQLLR